MRSFHSALLSLSATLLLVVGCGDTDRADRPAIDTTLSVRNDSPRVVSGRLPEGRYQLPTRHTPAPDLFISIPRDYTVKDGSRMPNDNYYIVRNDDPSISDTTEVTPGFLRVYLGVNPQSGLLPGHKHTERQIVLAGRPLVWKLWDDRLPDGRRYYNREVVSSDFFAALSPELARAPLHLHLYVAGADTARVAELMRAVESLALHP